MSCETTLRMPSPSKKLLNPPPITTTTTTKKRWRCDVCQVKCFEDFEEACRHEEDCQNQVDHHQQQQQQHLPPTLAAPAQPVTKSISNKPIQELQATQVAVTPPPPQERPKQPKKSTAKAPTAAVNSFFAPLPHSSKATKTPPTATATATAKELPTQKPKASVAAFFAPRGTKKTTPKESLHSKICVIDVDQLPNKKKLQQEVIEIHKEEEGETRNTSKRPKKQQHTMTVEHAAETAFALANIIDVEATTTNTNVPSFFNKPKEFIAEQRTAEFQAKRRMERLKELERQQKRQKADKPTPPSPSKRKPQRKKPLLPMAQRFPVPSHVLQIDNCRNDNSTVQLPPQVSPCWRRQPHTTPFVSQKEDSPVKLVSSPSALDSIEETRDLISEAMRNLLISPTTRCTDSRMWVDKYGMDSSGIVGQNTQETAQSLQHWINEWRTARQGAMDRMAERQRKLKKATKKKARKVIYKNDDDLWSDDEDHLLNVCLLTGPPASGKTSLVRQVARQCDCQVLEINTTEARGGAALKHAIQEATQSCSSLDLLKKKKSSMHKTFGGTTRNPWDDSDDDDDESVEPEKSSLTVILIDEADITYEQSGDSGFWTALHSVAKTAKCPIFLTCNRVPRQMASMHYVHRTTHRPSPMDCATKLLQVCQHEQIQIQPGLDADIIHSRLAWIAQVCNCDLRRMMHELQSFAFSSSSSPPPPTSCPTPTTRNMDDSIPTPTPKRERPIICSMEPAKVPADAFSIVTLKGNHLGALAMDGITVCIGPNECQTHRVDEETLMILCPPCPSDSLEMRIAALSIQSLKTPLTLDSVERTQLADGTCFLRGKRFSLEYEFRQEDDEDSVMDNGEHELDGESNHQGEYEEMEMSQKSKGTMTIEEGMSLWRNDALSKLDPTKPPETTTPRTTEEERQIQETLESLSKNAEYASDAALLEDMQDGIPFLSGACRGFAFDLTEEGEATSAKMRKHENSRPPREEQLFTLGWKDNCYFYGDAETYMTRPSGTLERRRLYTTMTLSRGTMEVDGAHATADKEDESEDLDDIIRRESGRSDEDMFLPQPIPSLIQSLPSLLQKSRKIASYQQNWTSDQLLERKKLQSLNNHRKWISRIFPPAMQVKVSCRGFGVFSVEESLLLEDMMDIKLLLEYLPALRRIGCVERAIEHLLRESGEEQPITSRRTTRRQAKTARYHYFDKLAGQHRSDDLKQESSNIGALMAESFLVYDQIKNI